MGAKVSEDRRMNLNNDNKMCEMDMMDCSDEKENNNLKSNQNNTAIPNQTTTNNQEMTGVQARKSCPNYNRLSNL